MSEIATPKPRGPMTFAFSLPKFLLASLLDGVSLFDRGTKIPKISVRQFIRARRGPERWKYLEGVYAEHGPIVQIAILPQWFKTLSCRLAAKWKRWQPMDAHLATYPSRMILIADAGLLAEVVKQAPALERVYESLGFQATVGTDSLFIVNDEAEWRATHDLLIPYFTRERSVKLYSQMIRDEAFAAAQQLEAEDQSICVRDLADFTSAAAIHRLLFGTSLDPADFHELARNTEDVWKGRTEPGRAGTEYRHAFEKIVERQGGRISEESLMAVLTRGQGSRADTWLMNQLVTLFFAGQETTRVMLAFALYELAGRPEWRENFRNLEPETEGARRAFLREVLRHNPPVGWIPRRAKADLNVGPYRIPAGSSIQIDMKAVHTLNWQSPAEFDPARFDRPGSKPMAYCPFGFGKRICIGQHLAMLEVECALSEWLNRYEIETLNSEKAALDFSRSGVPSMQRSYRLKFRPQGRPEGFATTSRPRDQDALPSRSTGSPNARADDPQA